MIIRNKLRIVFLLLVLILSLEMGLRLFKFSPPSSYRQISGYLLNPEFQDKTIYRPDPFLIWRLKPSQRIIRENVSYNINRWGFRGSEISLSQIRDNFRIILLGDSVTFGWQINEEETISFWLSLKLNKHKGNLRYEVINLGVPGYSSWQVLRLFKTKIMGFKPDLIIVAVGINDTKFEPWGCDKNWNILKPLGIGLDRMLSKSKLYLVSKQISQRFTSKIFPKTSLSMIKSRVSLFDFHKNLLEIKELANRIGIKVIFLHLPSRFEEFRALYEEAIRNVLKEKAEGAVLSRLQIWGLTKIYPQEYNIISYNNKDVILFTKGGLQPNYISLDDLQNMYHIFCLWKENFERFTEVIPEPCINIDKNFQLLSKAERDEYLYDLIHPRGKGNQLIAQEIYDFLMNNGYLGKDEIR